MPPPAQFLTREQARIFRITHVRNLPWILENGLHPPSSSVRDPDFIPIGDAELIQKRKKRVVPVAPGGTLDDYVPFYFTPFSPMFYNIVTGYRGIAQRARAEIAILVSSVHRLEDAGIPFVLTAQHAYRCLDASDFSNTVEGLDRIDWPLLRSRDFRKRHPSDPDRCARYEAEALVHGPTVIAALSGIVCYDEDQTAILRAAVEQRGVGLKLATRPEWYF